jgi:hypothetical protein
MISTPPIVITTTIGIIIQVILRGRMYINMMRNNVQQHYVIPPIALPFDDDHNKNNFIGLGVVYSSSMDFGP